MFKLQLIDPALGLPPPHIKIGTRVVYAIEDEAAEQVIVNEYLPGQGIGAHVDSAVFGPTIASLSLGSSVTMVFQHGGSRRECLLPARSLLVLSGAARSEWKHAIPSRRSDPGLGLRDRRVSLTFRTVA